MSIKLSSNIGICTPVHFNKLIEPVLKYFIGCAILENIGNDNILNVKAVNERLKLWVKNTYCSSEDYTNNLEISFSLRDSLLTDTVLLNVTPKNCFSFCCLFENKEGEPFVLSRFRSDMFLVVVNNKMCLFEYTYFDEVDIANIDLVACIDTGETGFLSEYRKLIQRNNEIERLR